MSTTQKTKWQQFMEAPKGYTDYHPDQTFALHVRWVVRSPRAAREMLEKGFQGAAKATLRDTPTTPLYLFRLSRDQRPAETFKAEVRTIGQHPHYQSAFKSLSMGIPRGGLEMKLKHGDIPVTPLDWPQEELIEGHPELDFDPFVLEGTEIYLDTRAFYEHGASVEWQKAHPEILKASRSLKPTTYCLGKVSDEVWERTIEPSLKAIRYDREEGTRKGLLEVIQPGVFLGELREGSGGVFFLELDVKVAPQGMAAWRAAVGGTQGELGAPYMLVLPLEISEELCDIRVMLSCPISIPMDSPQLSQLPSLCSSFEGRLIVWGPEGQSRMEEAKTFLASVKLDTRVSVLDGAVATKDNDLAGYALHPLYTKLTPNDQLKYNIFQ